MSQISSLETRSRQFEDDMQLADSLTNSQSERLTQLEADCKQLVDRLNESNAEVQKTRTENSKLSRELQDMEAKGLGAEAQVQELRKTLQAEETNKNGLYKQLETKDAEMARHLDGLRRYKVSGFQNV